MHHVPLANMFGYATALAFQNTGTRSVCNGTQPLYGSSQVYFGRYYFEPFKRLIFFKKLLLFKDKIDKITLCITHS